MDAEAIGVWKDEDIFFTLQQSGDTLRATQGFEKMKRVVELYPESTYGKIAADALRRHGIVEDSVETVSEAVTTQAEEDDQLETSGIEEVAVAENQDRSDRSNIIILAVFVVLAVVSVGVLAYLRRHR